MLSLIQHLQHKPEHTRKKIAFVASLVLTGVIVLFWLVSMSFRGGDTLAAPQKEETGPFQAVTENVSTFFADVASAFQGMKNTFSNIPEEVKAPSDTAETEPASE
ncbi:MAG: hypothetical protein AAB767_02310 [Patescibacteria group bacterium]